MATCTPTITDAKLRPNTITALWDLSGLTTTDTFEKTELLGNADRSVQLVGAAGAGGFNSCTVLVQGSNDGSNWQTLTDGLGNALSFTAASLKPICEMTRYLRVSVSSGTGGTTLKAYVVTRQ